MKDVQHKKNDKVNSEIAMKYGDMGFALIKKILDNYMKEAWFDFKTTLKRLTHLSEGCLWCTILP